MTVESFSLHTWTVTSANSWRQVFSLPPPSQWNRKEKKSVLIPSCPVWQTDAATQQNYLSTRKTIVELLPLLLSSPHWPKERPRTLNFLLAYFTKYQRRKGKGSENSSVELKLTESLYPSRHTDIKLGSSLCFLFRFKGKIMYRPFKIAMDLILGFFYEFSSTSAIVVS